MKHEKFNEKRQRREYEGMSIGILQFNHVGFFTKEK